VTVFAPDDLRLVKGDPQERRDLLDDLLVALHPRHDAARTEVERVLRQRGALLRSAGGNPRPGEDVLATLDVWDRKLDEAGSALVRAREGLVEALGPRCNEAYHELSLAAGSRGRANISFEYRRSWSGELLVALQQARVDDLRRGVSTVGPHRDDLVFDLGGMPARTHASQGEQRSITLALRLAGHRIVAERIGSAPILLLDDVFSELDAVRSAALLRVLPPGQTLLTSTGGAPAGAPVAAWVQVSAGQLRAQPSGSV
jgi:DNA replication and repair protein RecF